MSAGSPVQIRDDLLGRQARVSGGESFMANWTA
ncbi:MAG: hypothetical protein JWO21_1954 [Solirubrobacterales bacterium]|jgi:hypothetical protein|nr:hypothetical protein [Solirubrobacterales bacterium]